MGWVEERFQSDVDYAKFVPRLWDELRDSIGTAAQEFNGHVSVGDQNRLAVADCRAMGRYCRRVNKASGESIEVFLDENARCLMISTAPGAVCQYRIKQDRTGAEFVSLTPEDVTVISADESCRLALEKFIFPVVGPVATAL